GTKFQLMNLITDQVRKFFFIGVITLMTACKAEYVAIQPEAAVVGPPPSPGTEYVWMGGEYRWVPESRTYVYVPGSYVKRTGAWVDGHWRKVRGGYRWVPGHWR